MHPGRVDVIGGGALVWQAVLDRVVARSPAAVVVTSEHDILDGIALSLHLTDPPGIWSIRGHARRPAGTAQAAARRPPGTSGQIDQEQGRDTPGAPRPAVIRNAR